jgi:hypothetical protein
MAATRAETGQAVPRRDRELPAVLHREFRDLSAVYRPPGSPADRRSYQAAGRLRWPRYASRRLSTQNVMPNRTAASTTKMPVSMPWKAQNLLAGW